MQRDKNKPDCNDCHDYEERAAILQYDACLEKSMAERQARQTTCFGCLGCQGIGLFERTEDN
jgi:hypothetical protein